MIAWLYGVLLPACVTWVSRGPVNACIDWQWTAAWTSIPW